jgi:predicted nucleotidyltransferase
MKPDTPSVLLAPEVKAERFFDRAIAFCANRSKEDEAQIYEALKEQDPVVHSTFRYAIAKGLAIYLGELNGGVRGVYLYGSAMQGEAHPFSDIDLIVLVGQKRDRIMALLRGVDLALVTVYRTLLNTSDTPWSLLDVHLVDLREKKMRQGYGAILDSAGIRPVCLWRYTPKVSGAPLAGGPRA